MQSSCEASLNELCEIYWKPVYCFIRRSGFDAQDSEDLTQSFFAKLLQEEGLDRADREQGKLRSFLLGAVGRHLTDFRRRRGALKRGAGIEHIPLMLSEYDYGEAESCYLAQAPDCMTPDRLFDRSWAMELLARAHERLRETYTKSGKAREYELLKGVVATCGDVDYSAASRELRATVDHVRVLAHRLRKNFRAAVKSEIAETVSSPGGVERELAELRKVFL